MRFLFFTRGITNVTFQTQKYVKSSVDALLIILSYMAKILQPLLQFVRSYSNQIWKPEFLMLFATHSEPVKPTQANILKQIISPKKSNTK